MKSELTGEYPAGVIINVEDYNRAARAFKLLDALMTMEVKGHQLQDRLQFSEQGRALLAEYKAIGGAK